MRKILFVAIVLLVPILASAEPLQMTCVEPGSQAGALDRTCFYTCRCIKATVCACSNWALAGCVSSDDGNGGDTKDLTINVSLYEGDLPVTVRWTCTSVNTSQNETTRGVVGDSHTFAAE